MTLANNPYDWLPPLLSLEEFAGDWGAYEDALYDAFCADFLKTQMSVFGKPLRCKKHPEIKGKSATFWHIISEGEIESERSPNLRRCERIKWPKPTIEHFDDLKLWKNLRNTKKGQKERICIAFENWEYLVILEEHDSYILFWAAYPIFEQHRKNKLQKEYFRYTQAKSASE